MIKRILLSILVVMPLLGKNSPQEAELMAKINKLEQIKKDIAAKEKYIDEINYQSADLFDCLGYGYDKDQKHLIWLESNRLEQYISHALESNTNIQQVLSEPLCPTLNVHRNELDRMQHITVRVCMEYFLLKKLYQLYNTIAAEIIKIQEENYK